MAEMGLRPADVARAAQLTRPDPARERALDAGPSRIRRRERWCDLALARRLQRVNVIVCPDRDGTARVPLCRACALLAAGAGATVAPGERDLDDPIGALVDRRRPADAGAPLRADGAFPVPVDPEIGGGAAGALARLPVVVAARRPQEFDPVLDLARHQPFRVEESGVHEVGPGQQVAPLERGMDDRGGGTIGGGAGGGGHIGDQLRGVVVAGFGHMHFVADPPGGPLLGVVGVAIVGGTDEAR